MTAITEASTDTRNLTYTYNQEETTLCMTPRFRYLPKRQNFKTLLILHGMVTGCISPM